MNDDVSYAVGMVILVIIVLMLAGLAVALQSRDLREAGLTDMATIQQSLDEIMIKLEQMEQRTAK